MNDHPAPGINTPRKTRMVLWALFWFLSISIGGATLGLNGWPWRFAELEPYVYAPNGWMHGGFTIESLRASPPTSPRFVLIGGSACLEAITSDANTEARIRKLTGGQEKFVSVCSSYTTLSDVARIVDRIGPYGGTILLLIEPDVFGKGPHLQLEHPNLKTDTLLPKYYFLAVPDQIKTTLSDIGLNVFPGYSIWNYLRVAPGKLFRVIRVGISRIRSGKGNSFTRHLLDKRNDEARILNAARSMQSVPPENIVMNKALMRAIIEIAQSHGTKVSFVNLPLSEPFRAEIAAGLPNYDQIIAKLIEDYGAGHIDVRDAAPWPRDDFWDTHHMTPQGREKFTSLLVEQLALSISSETGK